MKNEHKDCEFDNEVHVCKWDNRSSTSRADMFKADKITFAYSFRNKEGKIIHREFE